MILYPKSPYAYHLPFMHSSVASRRRLLKQYPNFFASHQNTSRSNVPSQVAAIDLSWVL